jgi:hypothetical protein
MTAIAIENGGRKNNRRTREKKKKGFSTLSAAHKCETRWRVTSLVDKE